MFIDSYILIQTVTLSLFLGILELGYLFFGKKRRESEALIASIHKQEGVKSITRWQLFKKKVLESGAYQNYYNWIRRQLDLCWEDKETPDNLIRIQLIAITAGILISIVTLLTCPIYITLGVIVIFAISAIFPVYQYKSKVDSKNKRFDRELPNFINKTIMVLRVGVSVENAFGYGLQSMDESLTRKEFEKLVAEMQVHSDDIQKAFVNLNKRVQTEECERFCNIIVSGIRNGNKMSDILEGEYERISDNEITNMKKAAEGRKTLVTCINILLIFIPAVLLLVLPMMRIGELA